MDDGGIGGKIVGEVAAGGEGELRVCAADDADEPGSFTVPMSSQVRWWVQPSAMSTVSSSVRLSGRVPLLVERPSRPCSGP